MDEREIILDAFGGTLKLLVQPIRGRWFLILAITTFVFVPAFYTDTMLSELARGNADACLMLATEFLNEQGPDFIETRRLHAEMLELYVRHMKQRHLSPLLDLLYPELSPDRQLYPVMLTLKKPLWEQQAAREEIRASARTISELAKNIEDSFHTIHATRKFESLPDRPLQDLNEFIDESRELADRYAKDPTIANAAEVCLANRRTVLLVFLARTICQDPPWLVKLQCFRATMERVRAIGAAMSQTATVQGDRLLYRWYSDSAERRIEILDAIMGNDMPTARYLLRRAVEEAYEVESKCHGMDQGP
jgi:hypothetical protein